MTRRLVAVAASIAMIAIAVFVRSSWIDESGGGTSRSQGGDRTPRVVCVQEVEAPCRALARRSHLAVIIEPAGTTAARLSKLADADIARAGLDGWIAPAPWVDIVRADRQRAGLAPLLDAPTRPFARSPLVLVAWKERLAVLARHCLGGRVDLRCLGDTAGTSWSGIGGGATWGPVRPGHGNPTSSAVGLLVLGQLTARYFDRVDLSSADLEDDAFLAWLTRLERAVPTFDPPTGSPLDQMLVTGPAAYDVVATTEAEALGSLAGVAASRRADLSVLYPDPVATVDLVLAPATGHATTATLRSTMIGEPGRSEFARAGWRVTGKPAPDGSPALPSGSGLPPAGTLEALQTTWREATQ